MIFIGEAAAGPAKNGHFDFFESVDDIISYAVGIWDIGIFADIDTLIDTASEVFGEMAVYLGIDMRYLIIDINSSTNFFHKNTPCAASALFFRDTAR